MTVTVTTPTTIIVQDSAARGPQGPVGAQGPQGAAGPVGPVGPGANDAYAQANTAYTQANNAYASANTANTNALNAYAQANTGYGQANNAYTTANAAYSAANASANLLSVNTDIIPSANVTYNIGSQNFQWNDLWVSNNTIFIGGVGLGIANGQLTLGGNAITAQANTGNITFSDTTISSNDDITLEVDDQIEVIAANLVQLESGENYIWVEPNEVNIQLTDGDGGFYTWNFANNGALTFPDNTVQNTAYTGGGASLPLANGASKFDIAVANGYVTINANVFVWTFDETNGSIDLPGNVTNFEACSAINFVANSSGDGEGYSTIELVPDTSLSANDQYLIIDPTAPSHIHIRAGGQQDNSNASLFLGGENSYFRVTGGANADVTISANSHQFVYGEFGYGVMRFPLRLYVELPQSPLIITGQRAFITDANLTAVGNFGAVVSGNGANVVPVWTDGTDWRIG